MDGLQVESVSEHKGDFMGFAEVTQPIPVESGFAPDDHIFLKGLDLVDEARRISDSEVLVESFFPSASTTQAYMALACRSIPQ